MYDLTPTQHLDYSPLPARYYVRRNGNAHTQPGGIILRARNQAWWNLIWLMFPHVDSALRVTTTESFTQHADLHRPHIGAYYAVAKKLLPDPQLAVQTHLAHWLTHAPALEVVQTLGPRIAHAASTLLKDCDGLLETMTQRALLSAHGHIALLCPRTGEVLASAPRAGYRELIAPSEAARCAWLQRAVTHLEPHFRQSDLELPPVRIVMDRILTSRAGACATAQNGVNRISISPCAIEPRDILHTLAHELLHAVDNCASHHGAGFRRNAGKIGFIPRGNGALACGPVLETVLKEVHTALGAYPHFSASFVH